VARTIAAVTGFAGVWAIYGLMIWIIRGFVAKKENKG